MRAIVVGGTGLIGSAVVEALQADRGTVVIATRNAGRARERVRGHVEILEWDGRTSEALVPALEASDALVNLAGESVGVKWTSAVKEALVRSRVETTRAIVGAIRKATHRPSVYLQASAVGYYGYGHPAERTLDESAPPGNDFLADLCRQWESASDEVESLGIRRIIPRIGVVLSARGGALARMLLPFRLGLGGPIGSGKQPFPWVSLDDVAGAIVFLLGRSGADGVFNITAPNPATSAEFARALGRALHRPAFLPTPGFALKAAFGEMAEVMLLNGQRVVPKRLQALGYSFRHPDISTALSAILRPGG
jgi:uncharacterized protein (TIGR01777 family)